MSDYRDWKAGDRVVYIGFDRGPRAGKEPTGIRVNSIYTLKAIAIVEKGEPFICGGRRYLATQDFVAIRLVEDVGGFAWHDASAFRRVVPRKTDISTFTAMLTKVGPWVAA